MSGYADLHLHSVHSDGVRTPAEVLSMVKAAGCTVAALADHDTVAGVPEAMRAAEEMGLRLIPSAEISIECQGQDIHILAYFADLADPAFTLMLGNLRRARRDRMRAILRRLRMLGIPLRASQVAVRVPAGVPMGRPHLAEAMAAEGWVETYQDAFRYYIGNDCPAYLPNHTPTPEQALSILLGAGAVPVLAHPGTYRLDGVLERFLAAGLMGLEVYHPRHDPAQVQALHALAQRLGLLETGGSDYHGGGRGDVLPGTNSIGEELVARLDEAREGVARTGREEMAQPSRSSVDGR